MKNQSSIRATRARLVTQLRQFGFSVVDSQANFVWCTHPEFSHKEIYESLRERSILIRFMAYSGWGDGLRITVGTDAEIDVLLGAIESIMQEKKQ